MKVFEIIREEQEPMKYEVNLLTIDAWVKMLNKENGASISRVDDPLLLLGLVGDPMLANGAIPLGLSKVFDMLNDYKDGETIDTGTITRMMRMVPDIPGAAGRALRIDQENPQAGLIEFNNQYMGFFNDDVARRASNVNKKKTFAHEAMHRGFDIYRILVNKGEISPSKLPWDFLNGNDNWNFEGSQVIGEHVIIYSVTEPRSEHRRNTFIKPWLRLNPKFIAKYNLGTNAFNDRFADMTNDEEPIEKTEYVEQTILLAQIAYDQASNDIGRYLGKKMLSSPGLPKLRPASVAPRPSGPEQGS
jgi:hypothetical protein